VTPAGQEPFALRESPDSLGSLEERIQQTVQLVAHLRQERDAALAQAAEAKAEAARMAGEIKTLQAERKQVRTRIERLLGQIDQLSGG
jgi:septal ring factor EnvC (AmiA/AmiB activator)